MDRIAQPAAGSLRPDLGGPQDVFYASDSIVPLPLIERASGIYMYDENGKSYIDASSGPIVSNIGHGNPRVADAMATQAKLVDFAYSRVARHRPNMLLAERIARLAGPGYERVAFASGGSEAMEIALKFLRQYAVATGQQKRSRIITNMPSYHGGTIAMLAISGDESLTPFLDGFAIPSAKIPAPFSYRLPPNFTVETYAQHCADALEREILRLGPGNVLAFVVEPIGGVATGCVVPPASYFQAIRRICSKFGVSLVFDEILCGVGRTGKFLAAHHWPEAQPDIVVLAKGLGSGYTPLGAALIPARLVDELSLRTGFNFSHTYNANPIACAAGLAVLNEYDRLDLIGRVGRVGAFLAAGLKKLKHDSPIVGDIRGMGLLYAVEMVAHSESRRPLPPEAAPSERVRAAGLRNGILLYSRRTSGGKYGDWFIVAPPLTITEEECEDLLDRLTTTLDELQQIYQRGNLL